MDIADLGSTVSEVHFMEPSTAVVVVGVLVCVLLLLSGFASGSEIAFFSLSPSDINELEESKREADKRIMAMREDSERTLATILIANNLINVTIIMLCNYFLVHVVDFGNAYWLQFICITILLTFLLLLFGEIMPKIYSGQQPLQFCRRAVGAIGFCRRAFYPFASLLIQSGVLVEKIIQRENHVLSVDDLEQALELTDNEEIKDEKKILEGIVRFGEETAKEIMTSRQEIVDLDMKSTYPDVIKCIIENNYSRIPVYQDNVDNIHGVLYIKDLLPHLSKPSNFRWQSLIRPPYFVPETKKIDDLLREFQKNQVHIAIVVDEFGGTSGIVTLEDILEEIVGEINDEYDEEEKIYVKVNANTYIFEGKTLLSDFFEVVQAEEEQFEDKTGGADTLAGLLLELKGDFPTTHEKLQMSNFVFEVLEMEDKRISKVKVIVKS